MFYWYVHMKEFLIDSPGLCKFKRDDDWRFSIALFLHKSVGRQPCYPSAHQFTLISKFSSFIGINYVISSRIASLSCIPSNVWLCILLVHLHCRCSQCHITSSRGRPPPRGTRRIHSARVREWKNRFDRSGRYPRPD